MHKILLKAVISTLSALLINYHIIFISIYKSNEIQYEIIKFSIINVRLIYTINNKYRYIHKYRKYIFQITQDCNIIVMQGL